MASLEHHTQSDLDLLFDLWQTPASSCSFPLWNLPADPQQEENKLSPVGHFQGYSTGAVGVPGDLIFQEFLDSVASEDSPNPEVGVSNLQDLWLQDGFSGLSTCDKEPWPTGHESWTIDSLLQGVIPEDSTRRNSLHWDERHCSPSVKPSSSPNDLSRGVTPLHASGVDSLIDKLLAENWSNGAIIRGYKSPSQETGEALTGVLIPDASCTEDAPLSIENYEVLRSAQDQETHGSPPCNGVLQSPLPSSTEKSTVPEENEVSGPIAASCSVELDKGSLAARLEGVLNSIAKQKHASKAAGKYHLEASLSRDTARETSRLQSWRPGGIQLQATGCWQTSNFVIQGNEWGGGFKPIVHVKAEATTPPVLAGQGVKRRNEAESSDVLETPHTALSAEADPLLRQPRRTWRYAMASRFLDPQYRKQVVGELMQLATLYSTNRMGPAHKQLMKLQKVASPTGTVTQRLTYYMLEGLMARFEGEQQLASAEPPAALFNSSLVSNVKVGSNMVWGRFSEVAMTSAILSALMGRYRVHVVVLTTCCTPDWDELFAGLKASIPPGRELQARVSLMVPIFLPAGFQELQREYKSAALGHQAVAAAERAGVRIEASEVLLSPQDFQPGLVQVHPGEAVAVAASLALQTIPDDSVLRHNPRDFCLKWIRDLSPEVFVVVEMDADFNSPFFLSRFKQVLHKGEALLENLEATVRMSSDPASVFVSMCTEGMLFHELVNCVSADGLARFERAEPAAKWAGRMQALRFGKSPAEAEMRAALGALCLHPRLRVVECLAGSQMLWDDSPLFFVQAWRGSNLCHR